MNIQKQIVTSANWDAGRGGQSITGIVLHTMVGYTGGAYQRFNDPNSQVSVHYGVSLDGSIHQWVEEANTAYQAGNYPVNQATIGIEHEDAGNANDSIRTPAEYESSASLVADICKRHNIPCDTGHIFLHKNVIDKSHYPGGTACPDGLDTNKIIQMAQAKLGAAIMTPDSLNALAQAAWNKAAGDPEVDGFIKAYNGHDPLQACTDILHSATNADLRNKAANYDNLANALKAAYAKISANPDTKKLQQIIADLQAEIAKYK